MSAKEAKRSAWCELAEGSSVTRIQPLIFFLAVFVFFMLKIFGPYK